MNDTAPDTYTSTSEMPNPQPPPTPPPDSEAPGATPAGRSASMRRSTTDRHLGGSASALARLLGISSTAARWILVLSVLVGGFGVVAYALLWLFVPDDQGRVLVRGGSINNREGVLAAITAGIGAAIVTSWLVDEAGFLVGLLVGGGTYLMSRPLDVTDLGGGGTAPPTAPPYAWPVVPGSETSPSGPAGPTGPLGPDAAYASPPAPQPQRSPRPAALMGPLTVGVAALVAGALVLLHAAGAITTQPSTVLTIVLGIVGGGLLLSAWVGRARGLIWLGLALLPAVAISTAVDRIDLRGGFGERVVDPTTVEDLRSTYRLGAGDLQLDLTELDLNGGTGVPPITVDQGVGRLRVFVPEDWTVNGDVNVDFGEMTISERGRIVEEFNQSDGVNESLALDGDEGAPELDLDVELFAGVVEVHRELT